MEGGPPCPPFPHHATAPLTVLTRPAHAPTPSIAATATNIAAASTVAATAIVPAHIAPERMSATVVVRVSRMGIATRLG